LNKVSREGRPTVDTAFVDDVAHRPWPLPRRPWIMTQSWHDLLFAHWPIDRAVLASRVPPDFAIDLFDGTAWIGVVPFEMRNVGPRGVPPLPWLSAFPELNVRTYVTAGGKPGVYFFSLDAGNALAVHTARLWLNLPYFSAAMSVARDGNGVVSYRSRRKGDRAAELVASYRPDGPAYAPRPGMLDYFLTERYCLYARDRRNRPYRLEIHHPPWPLQPARADLPHNSMAAAAGIMLPDVAPLLHFVSRQDMVAWPPASLAEL
jgi:uncharacterized protein YqjF (DUF2071 family)